MILPLLSPGEDNPRPICIAGENRPDWRNSLPEGLFFEEPVVSPATIIKPRMSSSHLTYLMEHAEDLVPVLYDHARKLAARKYRWREGKTLPLGKTPEDIVGEVYVSFIKGEGSEGKRIKGARHFDPSKDLMLQLKGAIRSAMWALTDRSSAKNERVTQTEDEEAEPVEFGPTDSTPAELT